MALRAALCLLSHSMFVFLSFLPLYHKRRHQLNCGNKHPSHALFILTCARTAALCRHLRAHTRQNDHLSGTELKQCNARVLLRHVRGKCLRGWQVLGCAQA